MTSLKRWLFNGASDLLITLFGLNRPIRLYRAFFDRVSAVKPVEINGTRMLFDANAELHLLRAAWLQGKEPETLAWIDSFAPGEVFYDIGANIGVFSVYAALHRNCDVYAFEPEAKELEILDHLRVALRFVAAEGDAARLQRLVAAVHVVADQVSVLLLVNARLREAGHLERELVQRAAKLILQHAQLVRRDESLQRDAAGVA